MIIKQTNKLKNTLDQLYICYINRLYKLKIKTIRKKNPGLFKESNKNDLQKHKDYWRKLGYNKINKMWYLFYRNCSNFHDEAYIPENIYYIGIEPALNNYMLSNPHADKNLYELKYSSDIFPETQIRCMNRLFYDQTYNIISNKEVIDILNKSDFSEFIIKPSIGSSGGRNILKFSIKNKKIFCNQKYFELSDFIRKYNGNFLMQKKINQSSFFSNYFSNAINTIRICTYFSENSRKAHFLKAVYRMGINDMIVDNQAFGGISCGVFQNGLLHSYAIDKYGNKYFEHPNSKVKFDEKILFFASMVEKALRLASKNYYHRLLGFDFCLTKNNDIKIIEINNKSIEINFCQLFGGSLFGKYTKEIVEIAKNKQENERILFL